MKCFRNLVTLEISEEEEFAMPKTYEIYDAMHFSTPQDCEALVSLYRDAYHKKLLYKIAVGMAKGEKNLLRWSNNKIYLSAPVYMDYEGFVKK